MNKTEEIKVFIALVARSPRKEGWASVSKMVWPHAVQMANKYPELFEVEEVGETGIIKLTEEAEILLKWL